MKRHGLTDMPHLASRVFGTPLAICRPKLDAILTVLAPRLGITAPLAALPPAEDDDDQDENNEKDDELDVDKDGIASISVVGTLVRRAMGMDALSGMSSYGSIGAQLSEAVEDPHVVGILLEIDSPGGEVGGLFDLVDQIGAASKQKPVYAVASEEAYSAAYAIGSAADRLYVARTGGVGSVGVVALHVDQSAYDKQKGLAYTYVYAGDKKVDGNPHEALTPRAHADIQGDVDRLYELFVKSVAENRGLSQKAVRATEAATFMGEDAVSAGLADEVGTLEDALSGLRAEVKRRAAMNLKAMMALRLGLLEAASEGEVISAFEAKIASQSALDARAAEASAKVSELEGQLVAQASEIEQLTAKLGMSAADHAIELAKVRVLEAGLPPMAKDVEDDARELFAAGKVDLAKRTLDRHIAAEKGKVTALRDPKVRSQRDEEPKSPSSRESVLAKAKENAEKLAASVKNTRGKAAK